MNNIIEMKKLIKQHQETRHAARVEKENQDFNSFMWKCLGLFFLFAFLITLGLWAIDAHACNIEEQEPVVIKVTEAL